jgi:hypothetical protein
MEKQEKKIKLEMTRVAVNKRKEDFMIFITDTSNMDNKVMAARLLFRDAILQEMGLRWAPTMSTTHDETSVTTPDQ